MNNVKKLLHYSNRVKKAVSSNRSIFQLPELPYEYDDLEPHIDEKTMKTHHTKHHQGYVDGLNEAIKKLHLARESDNYDEIRHWERELSFNGSGHINHTIFWRSMTPGGVDQPEGLKRELKKNFGSIEKFESHFKKAASSVEGSGWGMLRWEPVSEKLFVTTTQNHQNNTMTGSFPVLLVDVWEHAYYLSYLNDRSSYLDEWWKVVDWQRVHKRIRVLKNKKIPSL